MSTLATEFLSAKCTSLDVDVLLLKNLANHFDEKVTYMIFKSYFFVSKHDLNPRKSSKTTQSNFAVFQAGLVSECVRSG